jgi:vacuolar-type H+-ATPase subunit H
MDELTRIKALEAELAAELEKARREGEAKVEKAKACRKEVIAKACSNAEARVKRMVEESVVKANAECERINAETGGEIRRLRGKYMKNSSNAVKYVLKELGV